MCHRNKIQYPNFSLDVPHLVLMHLQFPRNHHKKYETADGSLMSYSPWRGWSFCMKAILISKMHQNTLSRSKNKRQKYFYIWDSSLLLLLLLLEQWSLSCHIMLMTQDLMNIWIFSVNFFSVGKSSLASSERSSESCLKWMRLRRRESVALQHFKYWVSCVSKKSNFLKEIKYPCTL